MFSIHIENGFLSPEECRNLISKASDDALETASVGNASGYVVNKELRSAQTMELSEPAILARIRVKLDSIFSQKCDMGEGLRLLRYDVGDHYVSHSDAQDVRIESGKWVAKRIMNRDLSVVLYLNEEFEGGQFVFEHVGQPIKPETGMLVCFPSDWRHQHHVEKVSSGRRYAIVSWFRTEKPVVIDEPVPEMYATFYEGRNALINKLIQSPEEIEEAERVQTLRSRLLKRRNVQE